MSDHPSLAEMPSGYSVDSSQWEEFLDCWYSSALARHKVELQKYPSVPFNTMIAGYAASHDIPTKEKATQRMEMELTRLQKELRVELPQSYKDFMLSFKATSFPATTHDNHHLKGFLLPREVGFLGEKRPDAVKIVEQYPIEASDPEYFVYGTRQDDSVLRTSYLRNSILVGDYGQGELVLLNPVIRTKDGEMEAMLLYHSSVFRAPSFAELLRQISVAETQDVTHVPPYPQNALKGTCADKLPLKGVWWN